MGIQIEVTGNEVVVRTTDPSVRVTVIVEEPAQTEEVEAPTKIALEPSSDGLHVYKLTYRGYEVLSCECRGWKYRGTCRHAESVFTQLVKGYLW